MRPGLYIHVPFCESRCLYCNFYAETGGDRERYVTALIAQIEQVRSLVGEGALPSIFVGGGTPSLLPAAELERLFITLVGWYDTGTEFSFECNPEDIDGARLDLLRRGGVNRLSLGVQSLDDRQLQLVGRRHDAVTARGAIKQATTAGFRVSVDLIIGLPGQSEESFRETLTEVIDLGPEHLSLYCLELDEPVPLVQVFKDDPRLDPGDDFRADRYLETHRLLAESGYSAYEVSNWCLPGGECRHNLATWRGGEYLGCGPSAHSYYGGRRWSLPADLAAWEEPLLAGGEAPVREDSRTTAAEELEQLLLGLRTREGIHLDHPVLKGRRSRVDQILVERWGRIEGGRLIMCPEGWLRLDGILALLTS